MGKNNFLFQKRLPLQHEKQGYYSTYCRGYSDDNLGVIIHLVVADVQESQSDGHHLPASRHCDGVLQCDTVFIPIKREDKARAPEVVCDSGIIRAISIFYL